MDRDRTLPKRRDEWMEDVRDLLEEEDGVLAHEAGTRQEIQGNVLDVEDDSDDGGDEDQD